jgi:hypothetical protein
MTSSTSREEPPSLRHDGGRSAKPSHQLETSPSVQHDDGRSTKSHLPLPRESPNKGEHTLLNKPEGKPQEPTMSALRWLSSRRSLHPALPIAGRSCHVPKPTHADAGLFTRS